MVTSYFQFISFNYVLIYAQNSISFVIVFVLCYYFNLIFYSRDACSCEFYVHLSRNQCLVVQRWSLKFELCMD